MRHFQLSADCSYQTLKLWLVKYKFNIMKEMTTVQKKEKETSCNIHDYWLIFHGTGPVLGLGVKII